MYHFDNTGADLTQAEAQAAIRGAFDRWAAVSPLTFTEATGASDIQIGWYSGDHGDGSPFDSAGNILAHCFYPPPGGGSFAGDLHFDEDETWTINTPPTGTDLATVALHEIGHGIGLDHSAVTTSVMYAFYGGERRELTPDDIAGVHAIYGGWVNWFLIHPENRMQPGATVTALWSGPSHLDLFATGTDGAVWTTWWQADTGWANWFSVHPENRMQPGATVTAR